MANALLIPNLSSRRSVARLQLMDKLQNPIPADITPEPVNPWRILLGDDPTLVDDTLAVYDALISRLGVLEFARWLYFNHPYLNSDHISPVRRWWVLQRHADALETAPGVECAEVSV